MRKAKNNVKMIVDKSNLSVKFECDGNVWEWLERKANRNSQSATKVLNSIRENEVHTFAYEMYLDKFVRKYRENVNEVVVM